MNAIQIHFKNVRRGCARKNKNGYTITIPTWALSHNKHGIDQETYLTYYVCHELAHVETHKRLNTWAHCHTFKMIEDRYLADFGIAIERKKCYPKHFATV